MGHSHDHEPIEKHSRKPAGRRGRYAAPWVLDGFVNRGVSSLTDTEA